ncbi:MAG: hypothetical protein JSU75_02735 [Gammaproteobacteria bacterium]|nr:MAG: hypothetical protein JSU75_02735 [Gammaproteobacteria bacterium]
MKAFYIFLQILALSLLSGCSSLGPQRDASGPVALNRSISEIPDNQLLDVWVEIFDPGQLPASAKDASGLSMDIREAEARYMPEQLRDTMERTGYWGAVRMVPRGTEGAEVLVSGKILVSDGEQLKLQISAQDATGHRWFNSVYQAEVPAVVYQSTVPRGEPFQSLYNAIANDLAKFRGKLAVEDITNIRRVAELRFAADLAPDAFAGYLQRSASGEYTIVHLPSQDDPMYRRVQAIRERDFLLIDTLNGHFDNFYREMEQPYTDWRKARSEESAALREIEKDALKRKLLGVAAIAGAIAIEATGNGNSATGSVLRDTMVLGGVYAIKTGFDKDSETEIHRDAIEELGQSFASEAQPLVVDVEGETHELTGSAEVQYTRWRGLLKQIYTTETGLPGAVN